MSSAMNIELTLPGVTASVPAARKFVREALTSWGLEGLSDAASLVVSELGTNAVLHARGAFTVRLAVDGSTGLRIEVVDGSGHMPVPRRHSAAATTGRGMSIVDELANDWGVTARPDGKLVWVQLYADPDSEDGWGSVARPDSGDAGQHGPPGPASPSGPTARAA